MKAFSFQDTDRFLPYQLQPTARDTLQEFIDIDVSADDLVRILNRNQVYRSLFFRFIAKKTAAPEKNTDADGDKGKEKEEDSPTHRLINLLGMIGSRNLILALRMHKAAEGAFPAAPDGSVDVKAADYLKFAMEFEESFLRNDLEYSEMAYAVGVYFDWFLRVEAKHPAFKKLDPYYREVAKRAFRTGLIAYFLADGVKGVTPKFAFAAGALTQAGKLFLATEYSEGKENYADFDRAIDKNSKHTPLARVLVEREAYSTTHEEVGAHTLRYFDVFKPLIPAVRFYREVFCLKGVDKQNYAFAATLLLADRMASSWKLPVDEKDPVFLEWAHPAVATLKLSKAKLIDTMKRAMTLK